MTRLLLSHNHNIPDTVAPSLSIPEFCRAFTQILPPSDGWSINPLSHPHWRCALTTDRSAQQAGEALVNALVNYRQVQTQTSLTYSVLALGGLKTTPPSSDHPHALQPGEWGVDIVETPTVEEFLASINWDTLSASRPATDVFKVVSEDIR